MLRKLLTSTVISLLILPQIHAQKPKKQMYTPDAPVPAKYKVDSRIDNMSYWRRMASLGLVTVQPEVKAPPVVYTTSKLTGKYSVTEDSQDVPVTTSTTTQSENSIFVHPQLPASLLQSNNSVTEDGLTMLGADGFMSSDGGTSWTGSVNGAGGVNMGDPSTAISLSGKYFVGYVNSLGGQGVSRSTDFGVTWQPVVAAYPPGGMGVLLDKNHLWIDNSLSSPYVDNLYDAWTSFGGPNDSEIEINRSTDEGLTWSNPVSISNAINAGSHNQGVNIQTGPNGEVYAIWAIYDSWNPSDENALGFARSLDGGNTWQPASRIIENIKGIRTTGVGKNHRVNSYPVMAVDISQGLYSGTIYAVWCNRGIPGQNQGNDVDIYLIKSTNQGTTWTAPVKINQDPSGLGKKHYFPWITCDPVTGNLSVVYYDDRNVGATQCEVYTSNSSDGGATWWDMKVSDVAFTPVAIGGYPQGYMGDYLANSSRNGWTYPAWTDTRLGYTMTFVSPYMTNVPPNQPWVVYNGHTINDITGNNNGMMDYNETISLSVALENAGDEPANQVNVTLSTDSEFITFTDNTEYYGDILQGSTVTKENAFTFNVAGNMPDGLDVLFTITAVDANDSTFISNFNIESHAPGFSTGLITLTEVTGNGNGCLDAGESASISIQSINTGDFTAFDVNAVLTTTSPYITINTQAVHFDSIATGINNSVIPSFEIIASPETPIGHTANFNYQIASELHSLVNSFSYRVGLIIEDWESGNFNTYDWHFAGSSEWQINDIRYEGDYGAVSGAIGDNGASEIYLDYTVMQDDSISFFLRTSCEQDYDNLRFYIDNTLLGRWSGETEWRRVAFPVSAGSQRFRWVYTKDSFTAVGEDKAWIDYIILPGSVQTTAFAGPDATTCLNESYMLNGTAFNYVSTLWSTTGDGSFDNPSSLTCFYTPGPEDISNENTTLVLTVNGPDGELLTDSMVLSISQPAIVSLMNDLSVCQGAEILLQGNAENYTGLNWSTSGSGYFTSPSELVTEYNPSSQDYSNGSVTITLTASSSFPCDLASESMAVTFKALPVAALSGSEDICKGEQASTQISFTGSAPWTFDVNNGIGIITTSDNPYTLSVMPLASAEYLLNYITDLTGCQNTVEGNFAVIVNESPEVTVSNDSTVCAEVSLNIEAHAEGDVSYLWSPDNEITSVITVDSTGHGLGLQVFAVTVTDNTNGCATSEEIKVTFKNCTGIDENGIGELRIYPNPSQGTFTVRIPDAGNEKYTIEIFDLNNKLVYRAENIINTGNGKFSITDINIADGVYNVKLKGSTSAYSSSLIIKK